MTEPSPEMESTLPGVPPPTTPGEDADGHIPLNRAEETASDQDNDAETFPRSYVAKLRDESAKHRQRAADRDALAERLHVALVTATGRLADPTDLTFDDAHLTDPDALTAAIDDLLTRKPHLATRRVVGDVGQGATQGDTAVDLAGILRRNAS